MQSTPTQTTPPSVTLLTISNDGKTIHGPRAVLSGTTAPGATVLVDTKPARVDKNGNWRAQVSVKVGDNTFQVAAAASGSSDVYKSATLTRELTTAERAQRAAAAAAARARQAAAARERAARARQNFVNSAKTIPYNQLIKDPESYAGTKVAYHGQIFQIQESAGEGFMLLSVTDEGYGLWTDHVWIDYHHHIASAENDIVAVYGTVVGTKSYETQIGGQTYVPEIDAKYIVEGG